MRQLPKSKIIASRQCPKRLWLELHKPELRDDSGSELVFAIGRQCSSHFDYPFRHHLANNHLYHP